MNIKEKLKNLIKDLVDRGIDTEFSDIMLRQAIQIHYGFVQQSRVRDLMKGLLGAQFIVKIDDLHYKLGSIAYSSFNLQKPKVEAEAEDEIKEILGAKPEVD